MSPPTRRSVLAATWLSLTTLAGCTGSSPDTTMPDTATPNNTMPDTGSSMFESTELTVQIAQADGSTGATIRDATEESTTMEVYVVTAEGVAVKNTQVVITSGTATIEDDPYVTSADGGENGNMAKIDVTDAGSPAGVAGDVVTDLREDQDVGTLEVEIRPPADSNYVDDQTNPDILVVR